jgi:hypothetical protein
MIGKNWRWNIKVHIRSVHNFKGDIKIPKKILGTEIYKVNGESKEDSKYCPVCNKNITKSNLKRHIKRFHEGAKMDLVSNSEMKEEELISKKYEEQSKNCDIKKDEIKVTIERPQCPICNMNFSKNKNWGANVRRHVKTFHKGVTIVSKLKMDFNGEMKDEEKCQNIEEIPATDENVSDNEMQMDTDTRAEMQMDTDKISANQGNLLRGIDHKTFGRWNKMVQNCIL